MGFHRDRQIDRQRRADTNRHRTIRTDTDRGTDGRACSETFSEADREISARADKRKDWHTSRFACIDPEVNRSTARDGSRRAGGNGDTQTRRVIQTRTDMDRQRDRRTDTRMDSHVAWEKHRER